MPLMVCIQQRLLLQASLLPPGTHMPSLAGEMLGQQPPKRYPNPAWPCTGAGKCHTISVWMCISSWHCSVNKNPRHGLQGMFFCTCKKAGKCMGMSCKSPEKKKISSSFLLISTRRCLGAVSSGERWVNIIGLSYVWFYTVFMHNCNTWIFNYKSKTLKGN